MSALARRHKYILENLCLHYIHKGSLPYSMSIDEKIDVNKLPAYKKAHIELHIWHILSP
jgi:hypothetical protein